MPDDPHNAAEAQPLTHAQKNEAWWKVIGRFDFYFGSVNTKATLLIAFNTFVAGGIVLKWDDIRKAFGDNHKVEFILAAIALFVAVGASLVSLAWTFWAVNPFLASPNRPNDYHSLIFFGDIVRFNQPQDYLGSVTALNEDGLTKDLVFQAHSLAKGLHDKFVWLKKAIWWIVFVQLPALAALTLFLLIALGGDVLKKASG